MPDQENSAIHIISIKDGCGDIVPIKHDERGLTILDLLSEKLAQQPMAGEPDYIRYGADDPILVVLSDEDFEAVYSIGIRNGSLVGVLGQGDALLRTLNSLSQDGNEDSPIWVLGQPAMKDEIRTAKQQCSAQSLFPPKSYSSWSHYWREEGDDAVTGFICDAIEAHTTISAFAVRSYHIQHIGQQRFVFDNLFYEGQITVICAEPNGGKTTIMNWVCGQVDEAYQVTYLNEDCSGSELLDYQRYAAARGFEFSNLGILGGNWGTFLEQLESLTSLSNHVFVLDTLKKFVDVMHKGSVSAFYSRLRRLCNKGATFVLLAHTTKHKDADGLPKFDGVGDVMNDCDSLIYFLPLKHDDGSMTVSTLPSKTRGLIEPLTFMISSEREVALEDYVDVLEQSRRDADQVTIQAIKDAIRSGCANQSEIMSFCQKEGIGKRAVRQVLMKYEEGFQPLWHKSRGPNNACIYILAEEPIEEHEAENDADAVA